MLKLSVKVFKMTFHECFQILRRNSEILVTLLRIMLCTGIPELTTNSISMNLIYFKSF